jgi:putative flavoprotein involved in K+ transport
VSAEARDVVIGAGPAGLAVAAVLRGHGRDPLVLERAARVGESWRSRYDVLRLNTTRWWSGLPGLPIPKSFGTWVSAADYARYLERYAAHHRVDIRFDVTVERILRRGGVWAVKAGDDEIPARHVVVATGYDREPFIPAWPGADSFEGDVLHAAAYRNAKPFAGRSVLVVGGGNSAADIAVDLVRGGAMSVWISIRSAPQIVPRTVAGIPMQTVAIAARPLPAWVGDTVVRAVQRLVHGDLSRHGLPRPTASVSDQFARADVVPIIDVDFVRGVRRGEIKVVRAVHGFDHGQVLIADGSRLKPDALIAATGYRRGLEGLVGDLGVLDARGRPANALPGLHFVGYANPLSGNLREFGREATAVATSVARAEHQRATESSPSDNPRLTSRRERIDLTR